MWQRFYKTNYIEFDLIKNKYQFPIPNNLLLTKLSMFDNIIKIKGNLGDTKHFAILQKIMQKCKNRIKWYDLTLNINRYYSHMALLSPLSLMNAEYIRINNINDLCFNIAWSNKCQSLIFKGKCFGQGWCNYVINNCDCSNVRYLQFNKAKHYNNYLYQDSLLQQIASTFINLKELSVYFSFIIDEFVAKFLHYLKPIIKKNNCKVSIEFEATRMNYTLSLSNVHHEISASNVQIDKINCQVTAENSSHVEKIISSANSSLKHLILDIESRIGLSFIVNNLSTKYLLNKNTYLKLLEFIEITGESSITDINELLAMDIIIDNKISVCIPNLKNDILGNNKNNSQFGTNNTHLQCFKTLCQNIYKLANNQIPLDIQFFNRYMYTCTDKDTNNCKLDHSCFESLFSSYFNNKELESMYKQPKCNKTVCLPREKLLTSIEGWAEPNCVSWWTMMISNCTYLHDTR